MIGLLSTDSVIQSCELCPRLEIHLSTSTHEVGIAALKSATEATVV